MEGPKITLHDPESVGLSGKRLERIDSFIKGLVDQGKRPNAMVLVARHGKPVYCKGYGKQNDGSQFSLQSQPKDLRQDTIFRIYSMSKPITSVALMMLYEEGKFLLTDPVWMYLGDVWKKQNMRVWKSGSPKEGNVVTEPCHTSITVLHALTHTSGLSYGFDITGEMNPVDYMYLQAKLTTFGPDTLKQFVDKLATMPLISQPGSCWHYGFNTDLCGMLVEAISGMPFEDFLQQRIFGPLGMIDTAFWVPPEKRHRFADNYAERPRPKPGQAVLKNISKTLGQLHFTADGPPPCCSGGGGLVSTMHDYMRFCQCICNGGELDGVRLLSVKTVEWMASNHLPNNKDMADMPTPLPGSYTEVFGQGHGFGLGFSVTTSPGAGQQISSSGNLRWGGAANTVFWIDLQEQLFAIWMTQTMMYNELELPVRAKLGSLVYGSIAGRLPFQPVMARL